MSTPYHPPKKPNLVSVTTINADGSHHILHPADVKGRFTLGRRIIAALLMVVYAVMPWIPINGAPSVFLDVENRRFHLFGITLVAQDLWVLFFLISGLGFLLFVVTSLLGRIWCGWACPYTVFLDHLYRRIERWIDGDSAARRKLEAAPWTAGKIAKRVLKHSLYIFCAAIIAHVFLSYFVSLKRLYSFMNEGPLAHATSFAIVSTLTGTLYYCFAFFREQFCVIMCPYGRLQSALTDEDTVIIGYDEKRGEPRGKATNPDAGACVDCLRCIKVCPTGIDIRNGLQMECIGCAACIDACDDIMTKLKRPTGLIRYDSLRGLSGGKTRFLRPRILLYALLALLGLTALTLTTISRARPIHAQLSRMRGAPFFVDPALVRNHFNLRLVNKRATDLTFTISLENPPPGYITSAGQSFEVKMPASQEISRPLVVVVPKENYDGPVSLTVKIHAMPGDSTVRQKVEFLGPNPRTIHR